MLSPQSRNEWKCIFSRKLRNWNWVFPTTSSYSYGRTSARRAWVPAHNCMNEWLGEPVLVSQLPGRGILRIYINNLVVKRVFVNKIVCILNISWENKKVLVMLCLYTSRCFEITGTVLHSQIHTIMIIISCWVIEIDTRNCYDNHCLEAHYD